MIDQLIIGDLASFDDFGASLARRNIGAPKKKSIKATVPFSNVTHDFSAIDGEVYWEERELEYVLEILASSPEELEEAKTAFASWVMNVMQEKLHDPFIPEHYYIATYDGMDFEDEEGMDKTTATVTFTAYPYKIANVEKVYDVDVPANDSVELLISNASSHRIMPTVFTDNGIDITIGDVTRTAEVGTYKGPLVLLPAGDYAITLTNYKNIVSRVKLTYSEEVF